MTLVSVVIPAYNAAQWIVESIESIVQQSYRDIEIILVNDGSTDGTAEIARCILQNGPFRYEIVHQENKGPSAARNRGWRVARGSWIQFLDADDLIHPRKIEIQIVEGASATADVIYSDWQRIRWNGSAWDKDNYVYSPSIGKEAAADLLRNENFIGLGSQLIRVNALRRLSGFDETHRLVEDVELYIKIAIGNGVFVKAGSSGPLFWYRDHPGSLSKSDDRGFAEACFRNARLVAQYLGERESPPSPEAIDAIVDVYSLGARYFAEIDWQRFEQIVAEIEALRPGFVPKAPRSLRKLSHWVGYKNAERIAILYRQAKRGYGGFSGSRKTLTRSTQAPL
jgi:glycosyltransferase involved in cell wall biosynthesis